MSDVYVGKLSVDFNRNSVACVVFFDIQPNVNIVILIKSLC